MDSTRIVARIRSIGPLPDLMAERTPAGAERSLLRGLAGARLRRQLQGVATRREGSHPTADRTGPSTTTAEIVDSTTRIGDSATRIVDLTTTMGIVDSVIPTVERTTRIARSTLRHEEIRASTTTGRTSIRSRRLRREGIDRADSLQANRAAATAAGTTARAGIPAAGQH
jgi:hypothetical protein